MKLVSRQFMEMVDQYTGIVGSSSESSFYIQILSTISHELLKQSTSVTPHRILCLNWHHSWIDKGFPPSSLDSVVDAERDFKNDKVTNPSPINSPECMDVEQLMQGDYITNGRRA
ncbi:26S protease regulatory subunit 6B like [Dendrobium catenatum]|uniref:26S protease regulatory subunit 6B like n=1 Tax=Dendrobium catenatum TaxID=906689 RepID=A0A2I0XAR3_9ASPA|nr:26S protease regulatory subunit 6B like [Dendrobium catenatum]